MLFPSAGKLRGMGIVVGAHSLPVTRFAIRSAHRKTRFGGLGFYPKGIRR